jgi:hypothetical protein
MDNGTATLIGIGIYAFIVLLLLFVSRGIVCWYIKTSEITELLREIRDSSGKNNMGEVRTLLREIRDSLKSNPPGKS